MTNPVYGKCFPFELDPALPPNDPAQQQAGAAEWRRMGAAFGDGIINDVAGTAFAIAPDSSLRNIVIALGEIRIQGIQFLPTQPTLTVTLSAVPTGYIRRDRLVARYEPATKSITIIPVEGVAVAAAAAPAAPTLQRLPGGAWDIKLWQATGGNGAAATLTYSDDREWVGKSGTCASSLDFDAEPLGSRMIALDTGLEYWRVLGANGAPSWYSVDDPPWLPLLLVPSAARPFTPIDVVTGRPTNPSAPQYRVCRGELQLVGTFAPPVGTTYFSNNPTTVALIPRAAAPKHDRVNMNLGGNFDSTSNVGGAVAVLAPVDAAASTARIQAWAPSGEKDWLSFDGRGVWLTP